MPLFRSVSLAFLLACAGIGSFACAQDGGGHVWKTYVNVRYRYAICYPSDLMKAEGEAPNSDGQTFDAPNGAELAVFGRNNVNAKSLRATAESDAVDMAGEGGQISYRAIRPDWAVVSGNAKKSLFYSKTFKRADQFLIFQLTYPKSEAETYRSVVDRISHCFTLTH